MDIKRKNIIFSELSYWNFLFYLCDKPAIKLLSRDTLFQRDLTFIYYVHKETVKLIGNIYCSYMTKSRLYPISIFVFTAYVFFYGNANHTSDKFIYAHI